MSLFSDFEMSEEEMMRRMLSVSKISLGFSIGLLAGFQFMPLSLTATIISRCAHTWKIPQKRIGLLTSVVLSTTSLASACVLAWPIFQHEKKQMLLRHKESKLSSSQFSFSTDDSFDRRATLIQKSQYKRAHAEESTIPK